MKRKTVLGLAVAGIILLLTSTGTFAESSEFSNELSLGIVNSETSENNVGFSSENQATNIKYTHYFKPVKNEKYPIAEAAFVERVPVFSVGYMTDETDYKYTGSTLLKGDGNQLELSYIYRSSSSPVVLQIGTKHNRIDYDYPLETDLSAESKSDSLSVFAGYYIQGAMVIGIGYERGESELNYSKPSYYVAKYVELDDSKFNWDTIELEYKYVALFEQGRALNIELSFQTTDYESDGESGNSKIAEAWLTYYFNRMISLGLGVDKTSGDEGMYEGRGATLAGNFYINNNLSFLVAYWETDPDNADDGDNKGFLANANYKF